MTGFNVTIEIIEAIYFYNVYHKPVAMAMMVLLTILGRNVPVFTISVY